MRALTIEPRRPGSLRLEEVEEASGPAIRVRTLAIGVCGTDRELVAGEYGEAPPGRDRLVLGHESLGRVIEAPRGSGLQTGDLVAGIVRHPDPVPCANCALGEPDMCRNGRYTERGIKQTMVLENRVVFGTVNANRRHYEEAAIALERADRGWLERLITRRVPLERWREAYEKRPHDVKTVLVFED
jgi:threonine dehydrogenase-like Zn-dependent dehydrogenase